MYERDKMNEVRKYFNLIQFLSSKKIEKKSFQAVINSLDNNTLKFLCECIRNAISKTYVSRLRENKRRLFLKKIYPHKNILKRLTRKVKKYSNRKRIIVQYGYGFMVPILSTLIPLIYELVSHKQ